MTDDDDPVILLPSQHVAVTIRPAQLSSWRSHTITRGPEEGALTAPDAASNQGSLPLSLTPSTGPGDSDGGRDSATMGSSSSDSWDEDESRSERLLESPWVTVEPLRGYGSDVSMSSVIDAREVALENLTVADVSLLSAGSEEEGISEGAEEVRQQCNRRCREAGSLRSALMGTAGTQDECAMRTCRWRGRWM